MPRFNAIAATSEGSGFQYYDVQTFNFTKPGGVFLGKFVSSVNSTTSQFSIPKDRFAKVGAAQIMANILVHIDKNGFDLSFAAGEYKSLSGTISDSVQVGTSGGFPIFYAYSLSVATVGNNLVFTLTIANPSGVNDVTTQAITFDGTVFLYLAPF